MASDETMLAAIAEMQGPAGFDVVIVCCSDLSGERFWQRRLEHTIVEVVGKQSTVIAVHEDWNGGAGNGLGTLYAFHKACAQSGEKFDLRASLAGGASVAIYHTAGKGTRLAPLPGAENNNKPAVKLPSLLSVGPFHNERVPLTVLEAVMRQTSTYAPVRKGRVSVFWGDQVFVPSVGITSTDHPADIMAQLSPMPTQAEWESRGLHQYGLIAVDAAGDATQLEKVGYADATRYVSGAERVGTSLGSFSMSGPLVEALLTEFAVELDAKCECYDSDPHFWMPLTLSKEAYLEVMGGKGEPAEPTAKHYARMADFRKRFEASTGWGKGMLGCVDVGAHALWWDYGRLELYRQYNLHATETNASARALRTFLRLEGADGADGRQRHNDGCGAVKIAPGAVVLNCAIRSGRIGPEAVLVNVTAPSVDVDSAILIDVTSTSTVVGEGGVLYNVVHTSGEDLSAARVRADVFAPDRPPLPMVCDVQTDGKKAWKEVLPGNTESFASVHALNQKVDVCDCVNAAAAAHAKAAAELEARQ